MKQTSNLNLKTIVRSLVFIVVVSTITIVTIIYFSTFSTETNHIQYAELINYFFEKTLGLTTISRLIDILILLIVVFTMVWVFAHTIHFVPQGKQYTIERFGKYSRSLRAGLNFTIPLLERISNKVDMREQIMDIPRQAIITKDNALVTVACVAYFRIFDAEKATYAVNNLAEGIMQLIITNTITVMGTMNLDNLFFERDDINEKLFKVVDEATDSWGVKIIRIEIKDVTPPKDIAESMSKLISVEREKRITILKSEGQRRAAIEQAEGEKRATILRAEGEAEAKKILAEAEAQVIAMASQAIEKGDIKAINYFIAKQYIESLQSIASADNQKLVLMPFEASNLKGIMSNVEDFAKELKTVWGNDPL